MEFSFPLISMTNVEAVNQMKWISHPKSTDYIGMSSGVMDNSISVWDITQPQAPKYIFKQTDPKNKVSDFVFVNDYLLVVTKNLNIILDSYQNATPIIDERRGFSLSSDIHNNFAFVWSTPGFERVQPVWPANNKQISEASNFIYHFQSETFDSIYEQKEQEFESFTSEMSHFIEHYQVSPNEPLNSLLENSRVCRKAGKSEIADIWLSFQNIIMQSNNEILEEAQSVSEDKTMTRSKKGVSRILAFYSRNPGQFLIDINNQQIIVKEKEIKVLDSYEPKLQQEIGLWEASLKRPGQFCSINAENRSVIICQMIQEIINNGEFIHAYHIFLCLENILTTLPQNTKELWAWTYIELLTSMGFYINATNFVKNSQMKFFETLRKKITPFGAKCPSCKKDLPEGGNGECSGCSFKSKCSICRKKTRGMILWCQICGHGGHVKEMKKWFSEKNATCPAGCGHACFKFY